LFANTERQKNLCKISFGTTTQDNEATYGAGKFVHVYRLPPEQETKKRVF
jgi:hypothetical protein